jgi:hypothetical protein
MARNNPAMGAMLLLGVIFVAWLLLRALEVCFTNLGALRNNPLDEWLDTVCAEDGDGAIILADNKLYIYL